MQSQPVIVAPTVRLSINPQEQKRCELGPGAVDDHFEDMLRVYDEKTSARARPRAAPIAEWGISSRDVGFLEFERI